MLSMTVAMHSVQSALRLKPAFTDAWNNIASALVQKGLIPQAIDCYAAALRINPRLVRALIGVCVTRPASSPHH